MNTAFCPGGLTTGYFTCPNAGTTSCTSVTTSTCDGMIDCYCSLNANNDCYICQANNYYEPTSRTCQYPCESGYYCPGGSGMIYSDAYALPCPTGYACSSDTTCSQSTHCDQCAPGYYDSDPNPG
jgi:hypothetical protein